MKKISFWARNHKWPSRFIIIASFILLNILATVIGILLGLLHISIPTGFLILFTTMYFVGFFAYPSRSLKGKNITAIKFYSRQKSCDIILAGSTFLMMVFISNRPEEIFPYGQKLSAAVNFSLPGDSAMKTYKSITAFNASMKDENGQSLKWKEKRKLLKDQIRSIKRANDLSSGAKIGLIVLSAIAALGLLYVVASLSCSISCSGSEGAAIAVAIGGTSLVAFMLIIAVKAILGKKKKKKLPEIQTDEKVKE